MTLNKPHETLKNSKKYKSIFLNNTVLLIIFLIAFFVIIALMVTLWVQINKQNNIHEEIISKIVKEINEGFESDYFNKFSRNLELLEKNFFENIESSNQNYEKVKDKIDQLSKNNNVLLDEINLLTNKFKKFNNQINTIKNQSKQLEENYEKTVKTLHKKNMSEIKIPDQQDKSDLSDSLQLLYYLVLNNKPWFDQLSSIVEKLDVQIKEELSKEIALLSEYAKNPPISKDELKIEFNLIIPKILSQLPISGSNWYEKTKSWLSRSVNLRPINSLNSTNPEDKVSEIESALKNNRLDKALQLYESLPNEMKNVSTEWYNKLNLRIKINQAITDLLSNYKVFN